MSTNQILYVSPPLTLVTSNYFLCALPGTFSGTYSTNLVQSVDINSSVVLMPFYIDTNYSMVNMYTYCVAGLAASTVTMGIYSAASGGSFLPTGAPIVVGSASTATLGTITIALSTNLNQNTLYWAAIQASSNTTLSFQVAQMNLNSGGLKYFMSGVGLVPGLTAYTNTYSAGTLPTISSGSITELNNQYAPVIAVQ